MGTNILVVYYSHSGNTRKLAEMIRQKTGGELCELLPETPYPVDYTTVVEQAKKEIRAGFRPRLQHQPVDFGAYTTVCVGSPNWWSTIAPPLATFLSENRLSGKTVVPFCTHGGGGAGHIEPDIAALCPEATVLPALVVYGGSGTAAQVSAWLQKAGLPLA